MFETIFQRQAIVARHRQGPLAEERERYLRHFASVGATALTLQQRASQILSVAEDMLPSDRWRYQRSPAAGDRARASTATFSRHDSRSTQRGQTVAQVPWVVEPCRTASGVC